VKDKVTHCARWRVRKPADVGSTLLPQWLTAQRCYVHFLTKLRFWYRAIA